MKLFKRHTWPLLLLKAMGISAVAFVLSYLIVYDISSISFFAPMEKASDFRISDFYNIVADSRAVKNLDQDIVIISIDHCSREQIARAIEQVDYCAPRAVGLDLFFNYPSSDDTSLITAIRECDHLVLPLDLTYNAVKKQFTNTGSSFFYHQLDDKEYGAVNLMGNNPQSVIREFRPVFPCRQDSVLNFAAAIARLAAPDAYRALQHRNNEYEIIYYPSRNYNIIEAAEILENKEALHDKIVLIGTVNDQPDKHITPIEYQMPGVLIHAYTLSTILNGTYIRQTGNITDWVIAIVLCLIVVAVNVRIRDKDAGNLLIRILQILLLYLIVFFGCRLFVSRQIYINFAKPLLMVGLGLLASDIWYGMIGAYKYIASKIKALKKRKKPKKQKRLKNHSKTKRMKKTVLLLILFLCTFTFYAQAQYSVYKVAGEVKVKRQTGWELVQKRAPLSAADILQIHPEGTIGILDNASNRIFYPVQTGEQRVAQIINAARKQSDKITSIMNEQIKKSVTENSASGYSYTSIGASHRGCDSTKNTESVYASLCDIIPGLSTIKNTAPQITLQKITTEEGEFFFSIENKCDFPLYVNALVLSEDASNPIVCFNLGYTCDEPYMFVPPHKKIAVEQFIFADPGNSCPRYLLFGSPYPFDIQELQVLLNSRLKSTIAKEQRLPVFLYLLTEIEK